MGKELSCAELGMQGKAGSRRCAKTTEKTKSQLTELMPLEHTASAFMVKMERKI